MKGLTGDPMNDLPIVTDAVCVAADAYFDSIDENGAPAFTDSAHRLAELETALNTWRGCALWAKSKGVRLAAVAAVASERQT